MEHTKLSVLVQVFDDFQHILLRYSGDYTMTAPKKGCIAQYREWSQKVDIIKAIIADEERLCGTREQDEEPH